MIRLPQNNFPQAIGGKSCRKSFGRAATSSCDFSHTPISPAPADQDAPLPPCPDAVPRAALVSPFTRLTLLAIRKAASKVWTSMNQICR